MDERTTFGIEINRRALLRMVRWMLDRLPEGAVTRGEWLLVLAVLRPAESAARRLVAWMALYMAVLPRPERVARERKARGKRCGGTGGGSLPLFDRRRNPDAKRRRRGGKRPNPQVRDPLLDGPLRDDPVREPRDDDLVDDTMLRRRIDALRRALDDLPALARKLAAIYAEGRTRWVHPIRTGRPPGYRARGRHPVHEILDDCNGMYWRAVREAERKVPP